ncbi:diphthine synthase [Candidatus Bathyarchaeota archaeon]|nr:diphthine synthase [Candidatus Bathyarchaeota archaeon]
MGELVFVGLGLYDEAGISLKGLEEVKSADAVFLELYTSLMPGFSMNRLTSLSGKNPQILSRRMIEDENGEVLLRAAETGKAVLLVPGDPMIATTHIALRLEAEKRGIKTRIVHAASIVSAAIGLSGLHNYKFGKSVTIPFPDNFSETPYNVIAENKERGLHTLCLLDINAEEKRYLTINEALNLLLSVEEKRRKGVVTSQTIAVGVARAGSQNPTVKAGTIETLIKYDFGSPPYTLIFPGKLHFMEAEALILLAKAPENIRGLSK